MQQWSPDVAKQAKATVKNWFGSTAHGLIFLPGDGRALLVDHEEALAIRASAEAKAADLFAGLIVRLKLTAGALVVTIFLASLCLGQTRFSSAINTVLVTGHGIWGLFEAWRHNAAIRLLRQSIAHALKARKDLPAHLTPDIDRKEIIPLILTLVMGGLLVLNIGAEFLAHFEIDVIGMIPAWLWLALPIFIVIVALGNTWLDQHSGLECDDKNA